MTERLFPWDAKYWTRENVLFSVLLFLSSLPIWCLSQFPTQDGPAHLYNAYLLSGWWKASFPIDLSFFALNPTPVPNWFSTAALAFLVQLFPPQFAEKLVLTACLVLLPLALRYATRALGPGSPYVYFLAFPLVWNHFFQLGFFNFCLSLSWYAFFIGYWASKRSHLGVKQVFNLFLLSLVLYFSNGLSYYLAAGTVGLLSIAAVLMDPTGVPERPRWKAILKPQIGLLAAAPLSVLYFAMHGKNYVTRPSHMTLSAFAWSVSRLSILVSSFNALDLKISALFALVLLVAFVAAFYFRRGERWKLHFSDVLLLATAFQFIFYAIAPESTGGGGFINYRIFLVALLTLVLWLTLQPYNRNTAVILSSAAALIALGLIGRNVQRDLWLSAALDEYSTAANYMDEHKSLWAFDLDPAGSGYGNLRDHGLRIDPFEHAGAILALQRHLVDLNNYEDSVRNFPVVYKDSLDATRIIERLPRDGGPPEFPPMMDIAKYSRSTGRPVDYVLLWDMQAADHKSSAIQSLQRQLSSDYVLVYCAEKLPLQLYHLRAEDNSGQLAPNCSPTGALGE
jgi:hypothetical protein